MLRTSFIGIALLTASSVGFAQALSCNADLIKALRTEYNLKDKETLAESVHDVACSSKDSGVSAQYKSAIANWHETQQACNEHNFDYFRKHAEELAVTYLEPAAFETIQKLCAPVNPVVLTATEDGNSISVEARWNSNVVHSVTVDQFVYTTDSVRCERLFLEKGSLLKDTGTAGTCTRTSDAPVVFTLRTSKGAQVARLPAHDPDKYTLVLFCADDVLSCSVNGSEVGAVAMGACTVPKNIDLTPHLHKGENTLQCTEYDRAPPAWSYKFQVLKGQTVIVDQNKFGASDTGVIQPAPLTITIPD